MSEAARVRSVEALDELRQALAAFADRTVLALEAVAAELRRTQEWLEDQDRYWAGEIRKREEAVYLAKQELARRRMMKVGNNHVDCTEQLKLLRQAEQRLEHAEEKQEVTRNWLRQWHGEMVQYEGPTRQLKTFAEADLVRACALLEGKSEALANYLALSVPAAAPRPTAVTTAATPRPAAQGEST